MEEAIAKRQTEVRAFAKEHGQTKIGEITVGQVIGGMRGMPGMLYETSKLHPTEGIRYRGMDLFTIRDKAPKTVIEQFESDHEELKSKLKKQKSLLDGLEKINN